MNIHVFDDAQAAKTFYLEHPKGSATICCSDIAYFFEWNGDKKGKPKETPWKCIVLTDCEG